MSALRTRSRLWNRLLKLKAPPQESHTDSADPVPELPVKVYPPATEPVTSRDEACARFDEAVIPLAVDATGERFEWRLKDNPHLMVIGKPNAEQLTSMTVCAAAQGMRIFILDFKAALTPLRDHPGVVTVGTEPFEAVALINVIYREMRHRYNQYKIDRDALAAAEPFLVVINEYETFRHDLQDFYKATKTKGGPSDCPTITQLTSLVRLGRPARLHVLAAAESAQLNWAGEVKDNFTLRMSLGPLSAEAATMIHNDPTAGRSVPWDIPGRGTMKNKYGVPTQVQAFSLPLADVESRREAELILNLRPPNPLYERGAILPPSTDPERHLAEFTTYQNLPLLKVSEHPELDPLSPSYTPPSWMPAHRRTDHSLFGTHP